jgi:hypothetical protein
MQFLARFLKKDLSERLKRKKVSNKLPNTDGCYIGLSGCSVNAKVEEIIRKTEKASFLRHFLL